MTMSTPPAAFAPVPQLPLRRLEAGFIEADLEAIAATVHVSGREARLLPYNGSFPGPLLRVREGDRVRLRLTNRLDEPTNLHLHGLHIPPSVDDAFRVIEPGEMVLYEFDLPTGSAGTYWYHPHLHGHVARQLFGGLAGAIVVDGLVDQIPELQGAEDHVLLLKDLTLADGEPEPYGPMDWMNGKEGDLLLVNGVRQPVLRAEKGTLRLRLVNAGTARYYHLTLEGHPLHLIATDAGLIERPVPLERLLLAPGESAEVLVRLEHPGSFRLLNLPYDRGKHAMHHPDEDGHAGMGHGGAHGHGADGAEHAGHPTATPAEESPVALLTIVAPEKPEPLPLPERLLNVEALDPGEAVATRRIVMSESMDPVRFFINGREFEHDRVDMTGERDTLEVWEVVNDSDMDHPFHLHVYPFQVLDRNGEPEPFRAWRGEVNLRPHETVRLGVPLRDFTGKAVFHCHIVEHEDRGMMGVLEVRDHAPQGGAERGDP